ncbi:Y4yA family PLP-dependent enzyme [Zobellia laminariae]|uniref:Y4yA family PLP-dependent enzyme n=1 Tax=Zobellia laminariae TaxID=248906 RepID=UPI0012D8E17C|nr:Y4yA family PLP-dependent enzyme [Zobellia laminariae]
MTNNNYSKSLGDIQLTPVTSAWMHEMMNHTEIVENLLETYGSPLNIHHLPSFQKNISDYLEVFKKFEVEGQIYFARKANKSKALVDTALKSGIGVDTASYNELKQAIEIGGTEHNLILTAAVKNRALLELAIMNHITIIVDNTDELQMANQIAGELEKECSLGIRLSGFQVNGNKLYSRFGFDIERDRQNLKIWFSDKATFPHLKLSGFHFHLNGYSIEERGEAAIQTLEIIQEFRQQGNSIDFLDIGGGILMNYLESHEEWVNFQNHLRDAVLGKREPITFQNNGLGFEQETNKMEIRGNLSTYPFYNEIHSTNFLSQILSYQNSFGTSVAELINSANIQVRIEPGRSLLNQVGVTLAKVAHRKLDAQGNWLVGMEMNMSQLKSSSADFLLDPFIIYKNRPEVIEEAKLFLTGSYCLEQDVLLKRELTFPNLPSRGDMILFVNTAGYMMHFYQTESHLFNLSQDLFLEKFEKLSSELFTTDSSVN